MRTMITNDSFVRFWVPRGPLPNTRELAVEQGGEFQHLEVNHFSAFFLGKFPLVSLAA